MSAITPIEPVHFQSVGGPSYCSFFAIAPEGAKLEHVFRPEFWSRVVATQACQGRLHVDDMIRIRSSDRTFDVMLVVSGFRKDLSPTLLRWPTDPFVIAKPEVKLSSAIPTTLVQACEVLGISLDAGADDIKRVGDALRVANHPDHARDEPDRQRREFRSKAINAAIDLLSGKRKAA
jgi:hypothetical protein